MWDVGGDGSDWEQAEFDAAHFLKTCGIARIKVTPRGSDGGLDVVGRDVAAQVKAWGKPVGRPDLQRLRGAAMNGEQLIFFSASGYSKRALEFAEQTQMALFVFDGSTYTAINHPAAKIAARHKGAVKAQRRQRRAETRRRRREAVAPAKQPKQVRQQTDTAASTDATGLTSHPTLSRWARLSGSVSQRHDNSGPAHEPVASPPPPPPDPSTPATSPIFQSVTPTPPPPPDPSTPATSPIFQSVTRV